MKHFFVTIFFLLSLSFPPFVYAQTVASPSAESSTKYSITFPIAELGNCSSVSNCKIYCDDMSHIDACISFAKQKGFYKAPAQNSQQIQVLTAAKTELGCDSLDACRSFCQNPTNTDVCKAFAQKYKVQNAHNQKLQSNQTLEKAKEALGCNTVASCKEFCSDDANKDKCSSFAKTVGLTGGETRVGPGGCTSENDCKTFCTKNPDVCKEYSNAMQKKREEMASASGMPKVGPGGCTSETSCREYCLKNPDACKTFGSPLTASTSGKITSGPGGCNSIESCSLYCMNHKDECKDFLKIHTNDIASSQQMEQVQKIGQYEQLCKEHPDTCKDMLQKLGSQGIGSNSATLYQYQKEYCQKNPDICKTYQNVQNNQSTMNDQQKMQYYQQYMQRTAGTPYPGQTTYQKPPQGSYQQNTTQYSLPQPQHAQ